MATVIDLSTQYEFLDLWYSSLDFIVENAGSLKDNYEELDPLDYKSFTAVIENNTIICFSALQTNEDWGSKIGRCSTRMWVHPDYRLPGMKKFSGGDKFLNTTYCLPIQIEKAKALDLDCVFISREENFLGFNEYIKLIKINTSADFLMLPNKYKIFEVDQYVAVNAISTNGNTTWNQFMEQYKI